MMKWDETIKDKLKAYESDMPEGSLDEFRARLEMSGRTSEKRQLRPAVWIAVPAFAAALAVLLTIGRRGPEMETVEESRLYASDNESAPGGEISVEQTASEPAPLWPAPDAVYVAQLPVKPESRPGTPVLQVAEMPVDTTENEGPISIDRSADSVLPPILDSSPFLNDEAGLRERKPDIKVVPTVTGALGCGILVAVLPFVTKASVSRNMTTVYVRTDAFNYKANVTRKSSHHSEQHNRPVKIGASLRIPFNENFSFVTGADYSWYYSEIDENVQSVHYLGVPARLDWTILPDRRFGLYIGAGASADFCLAAYKSKQEIDKDGITFSLLAAGGAQYNITRNLSLYLEPALTWTIPSSRAVLQTYRTTHPLMFSLSTGLRFTLSR